MSKLFVITVASEKGGVGKTTIATNLAVYLKALNEDLPVTLASFDNHFSVDQMFALGPGPQQDVSALFCGQSTEGLVALGEYGVQYIASSRRLQQPGHAPGWLSSRIRDLDISGILILDTRPILDWFSEAALLAADIVLTPIKDRAALMNTAALRQVMISAKREDRLWLLPSLVDTRARLNADVKVYQFLTYAARERDYQVLDMMISKSPKVEGLASGFASRIRPILTHARNTAVHGQFKLLAEFVLEHYRKTGPGDTHGRVDPLGDKSDCHSTKRRRTRMECPSCGQQVNADTGHFYMDIRSRRRGLLHQGCYLEIANTLGFAEDLGQGRVIAMSVNGPGHLNMEPEVTAHLYDADSRIVESRGLDVTSSSDLSGELEAIMGRRMVEAYREMILIHCHHKAIEDNMPDKDFTLMRRNILRDLHQTGCL